MALKTWTLTDVERDLHIAELAVSPADVEGGAGGWSVRKRTLRGGLREGVNVVEVDNGTFRFTIVPERGMGLWRAACRGVELGWKSPVKGPVHPHFVPLYEPSGIGWLAGFDELLCRCGLESNGAPERDENDRLVYPLHGRIANTPAHTVELRVDGSTGEIAVSGTVDEARLYHKKLRLKSTVSTRVGYAGVRIVDEITNLSGEDGELELLYHINFGQPLLDPGSRVVAPVKMLVPRNARAAEGVAGWDAYGNEQPGFTEQVYFFELAAAEDGRTQALLKNAHGTQGVSLHFNKKQLPCFTLWKSTQAASDGYVTGLEPGTNFPNPRSFEKAQGRVIQLKPGATLKFDVGIEAHTDAAGVSKAEESIATLQQGVTPNIADHPLAGWTLTE